MSVFVSSPTDISAANAGESADLVDRILGLGPDDALSAVRAARPQAKEQTQRSYEALFDPVDASDISLQERLAVAVFVTALHLPGGRSDGAVGRLVSHYAADLADLEGGAGVLDAVLAEAESARTRGPYGTYREPGLAGESTPGHTYRVGSPADEELEHRLAAALEHTHLLVFRPRESDPGALVRLVRAGWETDGVITLSQLVAFLTYQVRLVHGLSRLQGESAGQGEHVRDAEGAEGSRPVAPESSVFDPDGAGPDSAGPDSAGPEGSAPNGAGRDGAGRESGSHPAVRTYPELARPEAFTADQLGWVPWLAPLTEEDLTDRHYDGLVDASRAKSEYFALLARDPEVLGARTRTDKDIFYNTDGGLPRAERELAATTASRVNGCVFCASVHARFAAHHSKDPEAVQRLLDEGPDADLGQRWNAITSAAAALTRTPADFGPVHLAALREVGLADLEIADLIAGSAFFNWANRLMLSLGEPKAP